MNFDRTKPKIWQG